MSFPNFPVTKAPAIYSDFLFCDPKVSLFIVIRSIGSPGLQAQGSSHYEASQCRLVQVGFPRLLVRKPLSSQVGFGSPSFSVTELLQVLLLAVILGPEIPKHRFLQ